MLDAPPPLTRRLGWFALYWLGSVVALGLVALLIRSMIT